MYEPLVILVSFAHLISEGYVHRNWALHLCYLKNIPKKVVVLHCCIELIALWQYYVMQQIDYKPPKSHCFADKGGIVRLHTNVFSFIQEALLVSQHHCYCHEGSPETQLHESSQVK